MRRLIDSAATDYGRDHDPASNCALLETGNVTIFDEPKIDCHNHLLDPAHFPYAPNAWYHPVANEQGTAHQLTDLFNAYGSRHALMVGPNSGYDTDNRCLLDFLEQGNGRFKGVAVVDNDIQPCRSGATPGPRLVGTTMQAALLGVDASATRRRCCGTWPIWTCSPTSR